ncbi:MAG: N-acetylneuraminate synthase family protein [Acidobacteriota bacterium]
MTDKVHIGARAVGSGESVFIIAEAGSNHNRKWEQAKHLIEAAAEAKADAVKFQLYAAGDLYPPGTPIYEVLKATELPVEWIPELADYAGKCGLIFFATPFSRAAVDCLAAIDTPVYKWASSETVNLALLKYAAARRKPVLLSTGMCDLADVHEAIEVIRSEGNDDIILLQCTSVYPADPRQVHLRAMDTLRWAFHLPVGFSDHTMSLVIPAAAVARGACVIEKHITIDRRLEGPDHIYALEPREFRSMVEGIRATEEALGSAVKTMLAEEALYARRMSLRAVRDIEAGEVINPGDIMVERPADGIRPRFRDAVIGRQTRKAIAEGEAITWDSIAV